MAGSHENCEVESRQSFAKDHRAAQVRTIKGCWHRNRVAGFGHNPLRHKARAPRVGFSIANPVEGVRLPSAPPHRERILSDEEELRLRSALTPGPLRNADGRFSNEPRTPWVQWAVVFALETAMRRGEILALQWKNVELVKRIAYLPMTKNGSSRHVPLSSRAVDILRSLPRSIDGRVFPISHWSVAKVFEAACKRAGTKDMRFHDLRHTTTSRTSFESSRRTEK